MRQVLLSAYTLLSIVCSAQDTAVVLKLDDFLSHVKENHPVALVASNAILEAEQFIRLSKGAFDPTLFAGIDQKYFEGTTYYSTINSGVKIPTRVGIDIKAMGDWNSGKYLNPQSRVPETGLTYLGVNVPLGRGLFTDERRTQLRRAAVALEQSEVDRVLTLNSLLYEAGQKYLAWQEVQAQLVLAQEGLRLADERLNQVRIGVLNGDRAAIDTVESLAQYLNRQIDVAERSLDEANARLDVQQYIWEKGSIPLELEAYVQAEKLEPVPPRLLSPDSLESHPRIAWYDLKINDLQLQRRLKIEQLKPQFDISYNLLQTPENLISTNFTFTNYKWGATFYFPLFLRKERGALQMTRLSLSSAILEQDLRRREIFTKIQQVTNTWSARWEQSQAALAGSRSYNDLAEAERSLFLLGESSLFLVNAREMSYLSARSKYLEYASKTLQAELEAAYVRGLLGQ